ncbi:phosphoribosylamine--glycine ligase [Comamonadaceae bacterium M7527]|nr:phosphoribosylamine--glycine ligase [Comamonadaceae bacterium M7527]
MQELKVLVIGGGGREHALAWKLANSASVAQVFVAPGNGGTALDPKLTNIAIADNDQLCAWAKANQIDLTVVGPEAPLASGVVDLFRANGLAIFGPTKAAAQLESSKAFSKAFMQRHGIPTAAFETFTDAAQAHAYIDTMGAPIVVKADGLAAGKGVVVAATPEQGHAAVDDMLGDNSLGVAHNADGARVVIEECLLGEEASFIVMVDGTQVVPMATSQDHKRLLDNDQGPNTGGMGAYSPAPVVTQAVFDKAMDQVIWPTVRGMAKDGITFTGFLYAGLMIAPDGDIKTLEFNCRMGDPETQPILMRLQSDLGQVLLAGAKGEFNDLVLDWDERVALGVVLAANGYPLKPRKGDVISGLPTNSAQCMVFHAGTALVDTQLLSSGGRVLCVSALADNVAQAQDVAYQAMRSIELVGSQYRTDIGARALS